MAYALLNRDDLPVMTIGRRKFVRKDTFFEWLAAQENNARNSLAYTVVRSPLNGVASMIPWHVTWKVSGS